MNLLMKRDYMIIIHELNNNKLTHSIIITSY